MRDRVFICTFILIIGLVAIGSIGFNVFSNADSCNNAFYSMTVYGTATPKAGEIATFAFEIFNSAPISLTLRKVYVDASQGLNVVDVCIEGDPRALEGSFSGLIGRGDGLQRLEVNGQVVQAGKSIALAISVQTPTPGNYSIRNVSIGYSYLFFTYNQTLPTLQHTHTLSSVPFNISVVIA